MLQNEFARLDDRAAPNSYVVPPSDEDLAYIRHFRQICKRYNIAFAKADSEEQNFVMRMAEKTFYPKQA